MININIIYPSPMTVLMDFVLGLIMFLIFEGKEKQGWVWTIYCARRFVSFRRSFTREGIDLPLPALYR